MIIPTIHMFFAAAGDSCDLANGNVLSFPHWFEYLKGVKDAADNCAPVANKLSDIWLVVAAVIGILLRIAAIAAVVMVIFGGVTYITSQGEPDKTMKARHTITNALVGMAIAVMATFIVTFIAGSVSG